MDSEPVASVALLLNASYMVRMLARPAQREQRERALRDMGRLLRSLLNSTPENNYPELLRAAVDGLSPRERDF